MKFNKANVFYIVEAEENLIIHLIGDYTSGIASQCLVIGIVKRRTRNFLSK